MMQSTDNATVSRKVWKPLLFVFIRDWSFFKELSSPWPNNDSVSINHRRNEAYGWFSTTYNSKSRFLSIDHDLWWRRVSWLSCWRKEWPFRVRQEDERLSSRVPAHATRRFLITFNHHLTKKCMYAFFVRRNHSVLLMARFYLIQVYPHLPTGLHNKKIARSVLVRVQIF